MYKFAVTISKSVGFCGCIYCVVQRGSKTFLHPKQRLQSVSCWGACPYLLAMPCSHGPLVLVSLLFVKGLLARTQWESCWHITDWAMGVFAFHLSHQAVGWGPGKRPCSWADPGLGARKYSAGCRRDGWERSPGWGACLQGRDGTPVVLPQEGCGVWRGPSSSQGWGWRWGDVCVHAYAVLMVRSRHLCVVTAWRLTFFWGCRQGARPQQRSGGQESLSWPGWLWVAVFLCPCR